MLARGEPAAAAVSKAGGEEAHRGDSSVVTLPPNTYMFQQRSEQSRFLAYSGHIYEIRRHQEITRMKRNTRTVPLSTQQWTSAGAAAGLKAASRPTDGWSPVPCSGVGLKATGTHAIIFSMD